MHIYDGSEKSLKIVTVPGGLDVKVKYDGAESLPVKSGFYEVKITILDSIYQGNISTYLNIKKAEQLISFDPIEDQDADVGSINLQAACNSGLLPVFNLVSGHGEIMEDELFINASGSFKLRAFQRGDENYLPSDTIYQSFKVNKVPAEILVSDTSHTYDGSEKSVNIITVPAGLLTTTTYENLESIPVNAGIYNMAVSIKDSIYTGSKYVQLIIEKATALLHYSNTETIYNGQKQGVYVETDPEGLEHVSIYNQKKELPVNAGYYEVETDIMDPNFEGHNSTGFIIRKFGAEIVISQLLHIEDGMPKEVSVTTSPPDLNFKTHYNNNTDPPDSAGEYQVTVFIDEMNYYGSDTAVMTIEEATGLYTSENQGSFKIYPNPNHHGKLYITNQDEIATISKIRIYSPQGKIVRSENYLNSHKIEIQIDTNAKGTYLLVIEASTGRFIYRIIIN
jgi:hypothetical protein